MKPFFAVLLLTIIFTHSIAQSNKDKIVIVVDMYKDTITKRVDGIIDLHMSNESEYPIIIRAPMANKPLIATPKLTGDDFIYEIIFYAKNEDYTISKSDTSKLVGMDYINHDRFEVIERAKSKNIKCYLDYGLLRKAGRYKIRICFKAGFYNKCYTNVYSDWISIYVKNVNFMEVE